VTRRFHDEPLIEILRHVEAALADGPVCVEVPDPDLGRGLYAGERVDGLAHRSWRSWCDLAERLGCRLLTPRPAGARHVALRFEPLGPEAAWHRGAGPEKYGAESEFARVRKLEEPGFLLPLLEALGEVRLRPGARVLDLGVNRGDELAVLPADARVLGVDHAESALAEARRRFPGHAFVAADLNALPEDLGRFDLVLSIGTLQSPGVDDRALLRRLVQRHLEPTGALLLGFPNCRFRDGEVLYGARTRNRRDPDAAPLVRDLAFYRRYLDQHRFRTLVLGKYDLLLTAVRVGTI
jgi:SAM-dependent methyltransferase